MQSLSASFTQGDFDSEVTLLIEDDQLVAKASDQFSSFKDKMADSLFQCRALKEQAASEEEGFEAYEECMLKSVRGEFGKMQEKINMELNVKSSMGKKLRDYTCADPNMTTTEPISTSSFSHNGRTIQVDMLLDTPRAKIWVLRNFLAEEECEVLMESGRPQLRYATVSDGQGGDIISEHRKAKQAVYEVPLRDTSNPLFELKQRIYATVNRYTGYNLRPEGQEGFTTIMYGVGDEYKPHCDGGCEGREHKSGGRVATVVNYCHVAEEGGGTTFSNADVFVKPNKGDAAMFAYLGEDGIMDDGLTEHSGCPIFKGEKWVAAQWLRIGVDQRTTWGMLDPRGNPK